MLAALLAAAALSVTPVTTPAQAAQTSAQETSSTSQGSVRLEDVVVSGQPLDRLINTFVNQVAAPAPGRGLARWRDRVCVGAANMTPDGAQYLVDRVSTVLTDVGLRAGAPGCAPNVLVVLSPNADQEAQFMVQTHPRFFRPGGSGMNQNSRALENFQNTAKPVRWWQISAAIDNTNGQFAYRMPGDKGPCPGDSPTCFAPQINIFAASRLTTQIVDDLFQTVIILDAKAVSQVSSQQLADYVAMVALAQINPEADTSRYASILNVFDDPSVAQGLTEWDKAYLKGLYDAQRTQQNMAASRTEIGASIHRAHRQLTRAED